MSAFPLTPRGGAAALATFEGFMSNNSKYVFSADWAYDEPKKVSKEPPSLAETIVCSPETKAKVVEALKGKTAGHSSPPQPVEVTIPIKIMTVPGLDINKAFLIDPSMMSRDVFVPIQQYRATSVLPGQPNSNGDVYGVSSIPSAYPLKMQNMMLPGKSTFTANISSVSMGASMSSGPPPRPTERADMNIRCEKCENSLVCATKEVSPVTCNECKRRYFMCDHEEVDVHQLCLGFDWEEKRQHFQCDDCLRQTMIGYGIPK